MDVKESKDVWVAFSNTDTVEGRGTQVVEAVCECAATAKRLGKGKYVMGSNCSVEKLKAYRVGWYWYAPVTIVKPSDDDKKVQAAMDFERESSERRKNALEKARALGLSEEDLEALR